MKERIEKKIADIVEHIISKSIEEVTLDDYTVLTYELKDIRSQESSADSARRMAELLSVGFNSPVASGVRN